ncbi:hypothetical protein [Mucilaginibacter sp.]
MKQLVSLQINLAPGDYRHARHLLQHQLNALQAQVDEIILTVDTQPGRGRFAEGWAAHKDMLNQFLKTEIEPQYRVKIVPVNYDAKVRQKVARYFLGDDDIPVKDFRGGPFYAYFFGLYTAANNLVFHLDSDILLGGRSQKWLSEALQYFNTDAACFLMAPLPGPPRHDDTLQAQQVIHQIAPFAWQLGGMSTRIFLIDKSKFCDNKIIITKPSLRNQLKALVEGHDTADLPEHLIAAFIKRHHLKRIDFLGSGKGMWSLHPPYRTTVFYEQLPEIIKRVENNDLPQKQQGFYDLIDEVCDWTEAREKMKANRWWKKH